MKKRQLKVDNKELKLLSRGKEVVTFPEDFTLVYENQIPNTGVALVDGNLYLTKKSKIFETVKPGTVLGLTEVLDAIPVKLGCRIEKNSKVLLFGKSEILEILRDPEHEFFSLFKKFFEASHDTKKI